MGPVTPAGHALSTQETLDDVSTHVVAAPSLLLIAGKPISLRFIDS